MNEILLINRLDPKDKSEDKRRIFFLIDDINLSKIETKTMKSLKKIEGVKLEDIVHKYNGIELNITVQLIPSIVKSLAGDNISIYSIYEIYDPM